jgi:hypothetical protein
MGYPGYALFNAFTCSYLRLSAVASLFQFLFLAFCRDAQDLAAVGTAALDAGSPLLGFENHLTARALKNDPPVVLALRHPTILPSL